MLGESRIERMIVAQVVAKFFGTNCWIIAPSRGSECIVVDPGIGIPNLVAEIRVATEEFNLKPAAIFITHGHLDHTFSLVPLQADCGVAEVLINQMDRDLLSKPERAMGPQGLALLEELTSQFGSTQFSDPDNVREIADGDSFEVAGLDLTFINTPGHTPGSMIAKVEGKYLVTGDTLFAGSIGRTDLPRGSISDMQASLREKIAPLPGELEVLPGHGERTRLENEMSTNPYLRAAIEGRLQ